jgi:Lon-like ATP-dependent protease
MLTPSERLKKLQVPPQAMKVINDELSKLSSLEPASSEYNVTRNYLDWLTQLPWGLHDEENLDVKHAHKVMIVLIACLLICDRC